MLFMKAKTFQNFPHFVNGNFFIECEVNIMVDRHLLPRYVNRPGHEII